jgi:hypothetical protein
MRGSPGPRFFLLAVEMSMKRIAHLGFGRGSGHVAKALAVLFGLKRAGYDFDFQLLCDSDFGYLAEPHCGVSYLALQPELHSIDARRSELFLCLNEMEPDLVIVDGIWLPFLPVMEYLRCKKMILFRYFAEEWFSCRLPDGGSVAFDPSAYDAAFSIEPNFERPGLESLPPLLMRKRDEILGREEARLRLGAAEGKKLAVLAHNGVEGEIDAMAAEALGEEKGGFTLVRSTNADGGGFFPLCDYAAGIDLLIAGAGYSAFYESAYFRIPTRFLPQERPGGEQDWRLARNSGIVVDENGADILAHRIAALLNQ